jgi:hypothetical protein
MGGRRSLAPWWVTLIVLSVGVLLGAVWYLLGGLPFTNHAAYGRVAVPGLGTLNLPVGAVWIHFEEDGISGENDSADMPSDLLVVVTSSSGDPLGIARLSENLFSSSTNNTGHVPYGRIEVESAGTYHVTTAAAERTSAVSPRITFGEPPWNPFGPLIVGALVVFAPFALLALVLLLPLRRAPSVPPSRPTLL